MFLGQDGQDKNSEFFPIAINLNLNVALIIRQASLVGT